ncbi:methyltransferase domain-containing protein [Nostocales cyanobacterium LEGE 11386]|nr:methyltransferase domain-containing protein [Nostocales cyanobacterium LEGE 11386]
MLNKESLPNYEQIAGRFDMWIPHLSPVSQALLERLPVDSNSRILDIACGTGEPGLTLARQRLKEVTVIGIDSSTEMILVANSKAVSEDLKNIEFCVMEAQKLNFPNEYFDGVLSRFGLMLLENPKAGCFEMLRILKLGGHYAVAVWDQIEMNTLFFSCAQAFNQRVTAQYQLNIELASRLAGSSMLPNILLEYGANEIATELFTFEMKFPSFQVIWELVENSGLYDVQLASLSIEEQLAVKEHLSNLLADFKNNNEYLISHSCRLAWGKK